MSDAIQGSDFTTVIYATRGLLYRLTLCTTSVLILAKKPSKCALCGRGFRDGGTRNRHQERCGRNRVKVHEECVERYLQAQGIEFKREVTIWLNMGLQALHPGSLYRGG